jgi:hypothetical protein
MMKYLSSLPLAWILLVLIIGGFLGGCIWRMSFGSRDDRRDARRD